jgi:DNA replication protein DnaC
MEVRDEGADHQRRAARRAQAAAPRPDPRRAPRAWDKTAKVHYDRRALAELMTLRFIEGHRNVIVLGPVGVGKTFLAHALGHLACGAGFRVRVQRADDLLRLLRQSRMDNSRDALMIELTTVDLLIIDDFALEPMTRDESREPRRRGRARSRTSSRSKSARSSRVPTRVPGSAGGTAPCCSSSTIPAPA